MKSSFVSSLLAAVALFAAVPAQATVINFDGTATVKDPTVGGLSFSSTGFLSTWGVGSPNTNGTDHLINGYGTATVAPLVGTFDVNAVEMSISWYNDDASSDVTFTGFLSGGGTVTQVITLGQGLASYSFVGFSNLSSLTITALPDQGSARPAGYPGYWLMDNLDVDLHRNAIPLPGTLALVCCGLLAGAAIRRRI